MGSQERGSVCTTHRDTWFCSVWSAFFHDADGRSDCQTLCRRYGEARSSFCLCRPMLRLERFHPNKRKARRRSKFQAAAMRFDRPDLPVPLMES